MKTVLFDIGGVLTLDPWESICLTPRWGLGDQLGLATDVMFNAAASLWGQYCTTERIESDYWTQLGELVDRDIDPELVESVISRTMLVNPQAKKWLEIAHVAFDGRVGLITDNISFFFARQLSVLELEKFIDPELVFASHLSGVSKKSPGRGLFEVAAEGCAAEQTLVLDDRIHNIERAGCLGFQTHFVGAWSQAEDNLLVSAISCSNVQIG